MKGDRVDIATRRLPILFLITLTAFCPRSTLVEVCRPKELVTTEREIDDKETISYRWLALVRHKDLRRGEPVSIFFLLNRSILNICVTGFEERRVFRPSVEEEEKVFQTQGFSRAKAVHESEKDKVDYPT